MARKMGIRGLDSANEVDPRHLLRDTRTLGQRIYDFFTNPVYVALLLIALAACAFLFPAIADILFIIGIWSFSFAFTRRNTLPFRLPQRSGLMDYNDLKPGGGQRPNKARGITYFGNDIQTNEEIWFNNDDMRTHVLLFGSTGSGKTETLISLAYNSLIQGSGFIYVDGKGDNTLFSKIFSLARSMGREDDLLVINYMTGARDIVGPQTKRLSNTFNPFASGSSSMLAQMVVGLMDASAASPDGDMWKGRAISFVEALMKTLAYARDEELILLDANTVRFYFPLDKVEAIVVDKQLIRPDQEPASLADAPEVVIEPLRNYLDNLPGWRPDKKGKHGNQTLEQHGFITMQLTRVFTSLADTYGHIMRTRLAEVDVNDVVLNRRILVVLLPALEKSPDELSNLGKIIVASLKAMMASGLGEDVEGAYRDVIQRKPTNAPTPFVCILDEYGYYAVEGFAVVPAQARSLGFSTVFAGQDYPAFQKASKEEAASIGANTNIKICMKLEDPTETWEFFQKTASEAYVTKVDHFQTKPQSVMNSYLDTRSASFERRARVELLDLKDQGVGEAHIFFKSNIIRAKLFYANPKPVKYMQLNQLLEVSKPKSRFLFDLEKRLESFQELLEKGDIFANVESKNDDIIVLSEALHAKAQLPTMERSLDALITLYERAAPIQLKATKENLPDAELNIFTPLRVKEAPDSYLTHNFAEFSQPILDKQNALDYIQGLERITGKSEKHAANISEEIVKDMRLATHYPPEQVYQPTSKEIAGVIDNLIDKIHNARKKADQKTED